MLDKQEIIDFALTLDIDLIRFSGAGCLEEEKRRFEEWIELGCNAGMKWLERSIEKRFDPCLGLKDAKTIVTAAISYNTGKAPAAISRHAAGKDYHVVLEGKLEKIRGFLKRDDPTVKAKICVDSSVIAEKSFAARSGTGWIGRNSLLINEKLGSWFFLAELIIDREYEPDAPVTDKCGECRECIKACPTGAIRENRIIDAGKCIAYLTIEDKNCAPHPGKSGIHKPFAYGCDICQEVCPWNRNAAGTREPAFIESNGLFSLSREELLRLSEDDFNELSRGTSLERISYEKFMANLEICRNL
jgi:epoxyqueuosine reductase